MEVRITNHNDLEGILEILNREIVEGVAHFGLEPQSHAQIEREFKGANPLHPWLSAIEDGKVLGFCRAGPWKSRGAYAQSAEVGVYAARECQGKGIGTTLYRAFIPQCFDRGLHVLIAGIRLPNHPCVRLHERFGFQHVGTLPEVGWKFDQWHSVGYWALTASDWETVSQCPPTSPTK